MVTLFNLSGVKQLELIVDGNSEMIETKVETIEELLVEQGIVLGTYDRVSAPLRDDVDLHERVTVTHAVPITLEADRQTIELHTTASDVAELLREASIQLEPLDIVKPGLDAPIRSGDHIRITRIDKQIVEETEIIPYNIVSREDRTLSRGKEKVVQEGQPGVTLHVIERVYRDGQLAEERTLASHSQQEVTDKIIAHGTRSEVMILSASSPNVQTVTREGITFGVKKVIEATLTAYDAGIESTGKTEDHPEYGVTYTGTIVEEGRTAAVDPKVIPFGWWIYIEGYGFRRAEDKGSAIKGNWIDIYFDSYDDAVTFGKKKGTVYIIGPDHPAES